MFLYSERGEHSLRCHTAFKISFWTPISALVSWLASLIPKRMNKISCEFLNIFKCAVGHTHVILLGRTALMMLDSHSSLQRASSLANWHTQSSQDVTGSFSTGCYARMYECSGDLSFCTPEYEVAPFPAHWPNLNSFFAVGEFVGFMSPLRSGLFCLRSKMVRLGLSSSHCGLQELISCFFKLLQMWKNILNASIFVMCYQTCWYPACTRFAVSQFLVDNIVYVSDHNWGTVSHRVSEVGYSTHAALTSNLDVLDWPSSWMFCRALSNFVYHLTT